jgi:hypothetical protein
VISIRFSITLDGGLRLPERRFRTGRDGGQLAGLDHLGVAADRAGDEIGALLLQPLADGGGLLDRDGRAIDYHFRHLAVLGDAVRSEIDLLDVLAG